MKDIYIRLLSYIYQHVDRPFFITYFKDSALLEITDTTVTIGISRPMFLAWHEMNTKDLFLQAAKEITPSIQSVLFVMEPTLDGDKQRTIDIIAHFPDLSKGRKLPKKQETRLSNGITTKILNPKYMFSTFVVGSNNQMAFAAANAVAGNPGTKYNPLFIYGGVGLGKTHLLQAIGNEVLLNDPNKVIVYVTSETFTNEVVQSLASRSMDKIRKRYREVDVLIIDDIQFFSGKDRTQEEFFHTFNTLHELGKQVVISSDRAPKELHGIEERIISRCEMGMTVDTKMPDYETRLAILYDKAKDYQTLIPTDVFEFIAFNVHNSIRELEGILLQVIALIELQKETPTKALVAQIIRRLNKDISLHGFEEHTPVLVQSLQDICEYIADYYHVTVSDLLSQKRSQDIVLPRQVAMYLGYNALHLPLKRVADFFGKKDHTSVMHALKKITSDQANDPVLKRDIEHLKKYMGMAFEH